jgi:hypothetical protein
MQNKPKTFHIRASASTYNPLTETLEYDEELYTISSTQSALALERALFKIEAKYPSHNSYSAELAEPL